MSKPLSFTIFIASTNSDHERAFTSKESALKFLSDLQTEDESYGWKFEYSIRELTVYGEPTGGAA